MIGRIPGIPIAAKLALVKRDRRFRFLMTPGKEFVFDGYLGNLKVNVDPVYPIELEMMTGEYDPITSSVIRQFVARDSVAIDVGANVGALTLLMATLAADGKVIAIEPGPPTFARLKKNLALNPSVSRVVQPLQVGVADKEGQLFWNEDPTNRGNAGMLASQGEPVAVQTLDTVIDRLGLERLDFVKIDVEGMEYEVIKGAMSSIITFRPVIYYETLESFREFRAFDIFGETHKLLAGANYQHFSVLPDGSLSRIDNLQDLRSANTLAIPAERQGSSR
jgi:FkbM family methyltransferase